MMACRPPARRRSGESNRAAGAANWARKEWRLFWRPNMCRWPWRRWWHMNVSSLFPAYLNIPRSELGRDQPVKVNVVGGAACVARAMAEEMLEQIRRAQHQGRGATLIVPVGPVDQFPM